MVKSSNSRVVLAAHVKRSVHAFRTFAEHPYFVARRSTANPLLKSCRETSAIAKTVVPFRLPLRMIRALVASMYVRKPQRRIDVASLVKRARMILPRKHRGDEQAR
jgi:hypothetical protein